MPNNALDLDQMQNAYKVAVEEWITAIKQEVWDPLESTCRHASLSIL